MKLSLLNRGKVRELYEFVEGDSRLPDLCFETQRYIIEGRFVLEKNRCLVGTIFDDEEYEKLSQLVKTNNKEDGSVDRALDLMFLGYESK